MLASILLGLVALAACGYAVYYAWSAKRWLWAEITGLKHAHETLQRDLVSARKQIVLTATAGTLRLPAMLPSQNGEDVLLYDFFGGRRDGLFVEIGAYDGVGFSNTYFLEALGWSGILVEAVPTQFEACKQARPHSRVIHAACGQGGGGTVRFKFVRGGGGVGTLSHMGDDPEHTARIEREGGRIEEVEVPLMSLGEIMRAESNRIDVLSIDVEGAELDVLAGCSLDKLTPAVIILEDNSGGKDRRVPDLLAAAGYRVGLVWTHNVFYVRDDEKRRIGW